MPPRPPVRAPKNTLEGNEPSNVLRWTSTRHAKPVANERLLKEGAICAGPTGRAAGTCLILQSHPAKCGTVSCGSGWPRPAPALPAHEKARDLPRVHAANHGLTRKAEGMGFEPTTHCWASDFESDRWPIRLPSGSTPFNVGRTSAALKFGSALCGRQPCRATPTSRSGGRLQRFCRKGTACRQGTSVTATTTSPSLP